jgi:hypothetical protein
MFNRFNYNLPSGLSSESFSEFFTSLFTFSTPEDAEASKNHTTKVMANPSYSILAITVPMFLADEDPPTLSHFIVGAALYTRDNKNGIFVSLVGIYGQGDSSPCALSSKFFVDPDQKDLLSDTGSFRGYGLSVFLLSALQVLGSLGFKAPHIPPLEPLFIACDENMTEEDSPSTHHLYLQARIEPNHAYQMYVQLGFTNANGTFRCTSLQDDCPVNRLRKKGRSGLEAGYSVDDALLRLLVLRKWIVNTWPTSSSLTTALHDATEVWNSPGLSSRQYLSSALVLPDRTAATQEHTNAAYHQLLECYHYVDSKPLQFPLPSSPPDCSPLPPDRDLTRLVRDIMKSIKMISGDEIKPYDLRRSFFRSLVAVTSTPDDYLLDSFDAVAAAMYTAGNLGSGDDAIYKQRALELRLNVVSFYFRCAHFTFTTSALQAWAASVIEEYEVLVTNQVQEEHGVAGFDGSIPSFAESLEDRIKWNDNFRFLARRLSNPDMAPLWSDLHALQILFSLSDTPVYFAPVYGRLLTTAGQMCGAYPQVPSLASMISIEGPTVLGDEEVPLVFTVVPILALTWYTFGFFSHTVLENSIDRLCETLANYRPPHSVPVTTFRKQPLMRLLNETLKTIFPGHCASDALCHMLTMKKLPADAKKHRCPGCGRAVHPGCGYKNPKLDKVERVTCHLCFDKFGRTITGKDDVLYMSQKAKKPLKDDGNKSDDSSTTNDGSPAKNTRLNRPTGLKLPPSRTPLFAFRESTPRRLELDDELDEKNPSGMYPESCDPPKGDPEDKWWLDEDGNEIDGITPEFSAHFEEEAVESHLYSRAEMLAKCNHSNRVEAVQRKSFHDIIRSAMALQTNITEAEATTDKLPIGLHRPKTPYSTQELVNICCLVDRGREFEVDMLYEGSSTELSLRVDSYLLDPKLSLKAYLKVKKGETLGKKLMMVVFKTWLKNYLDWFDPELFEYIQAQADGVPVITLPDRMAADDGPLYEFQGCKVYDKLMVPLPKKHEVISTRKEFGVTKDGVFRPYCGDTYAKKPTHSHAVRYAKYDSKLTASCNQKDVFEFVPVARMPSSKVPSHLVQIKAIRAEIVVHKTIKHTRWLGLQGGKYVTLPEEWVQINFDESVLKEAMKRAENVLKGKRETKQRFLPLPVGDSREDDPPDHIRDNQGLNYYYQGKVDNCVMGGLANAVFWMTGPDSSDGLLSTFSPIIEEFWFGFVKHVNHSLKNFLLKKLKCSDILKMDDSLPVVVQLRSGDKSETHAICIYNGRIYDSASRYVLVKSEDALNWCCGSFGFSAHLRLYQLIPKESQEKEKKTRRAKRSRPG